MTRTASAENPERGRLVLASLWSLQVLLALIYLFTGLTKLLLPIPVLEAQMPIPLPGALLRFIGLAETLGALGLVVPGLLGFRTELTPLAAAGLALVMAGATVYTLAGGGGLIALMPFVLGILDLLVLYCRTRVAPLREDPYLPFLKPSIGTS
jgi:DoxX-like family